MLSIRIQNNKKEDVIYIDGDQQPVKELHDLLDGHSKPWFSYTNSRELVRVGSSGELEWQPLKYTSITFGVWNLKKSNGRSQLIDYFLAYILSHKNQVKIDEHDVSLLKYWQYEANMISLGLSYRSKYPETSQTLTLLEPLAALMKKCGYLSHPSVFTLLENSPAAKDGFNSPDLPCEADIANAVALYQASKEAKGASVVAVSMFERSIPATTLAAENQQFLSTLAAAPKK